MGTELLHEEKETKPHWGPLSKPQKPKGGNDKIGKLGYETLLEWYGEKHRGPSSVEIDLINSNVPANAHTAKKARSFKTERMEGGVQRYLCLHCGRRFRPLTGTLMEGAKIPVSEWMEFWLHIFEFHSVKTAARDKGDHETEAGRGDQDG